jgi:hypothetical protein
MTSKFTVCIDSSSRDMIAYPNRSEFRFKLPDSYRDVVAVSCDMIVIPNYPNLNMPYITLHIDELKNPKMVLSQNTFTRDIFALFPMCKGSCFKSEVETPPPNPCEPILPTPCEPPCLEPTCCGKDINWGSICLDKPGAKHSFQPALRKLEYITIRLAGPDGTPLNLGKDNVIRCSPKVYSQWLLVLTFECTNTTTPFPVRPSQFLE